MVNQSYDPQKPMEMFDQLMPVDFIKDTLACLRECYSGAHSRCLDFPATEAHDLRPYYRKALFESQWRDVAKKHQLKAAAKLNKGRNSFHTRIKCGQVVLTASSVPDPSCIVRHAHFRETYAQNNQPSLFEPQKTPSPDALLYAILIHGGVKDQPGFADIVFPSPDCDRYLARIQLFQRYTEFAKKVTVTEEIVPDTAAPRLRKDTETKSKNA